MLVPWLNLIFFLFIAFCIIIMKFYHIYFIIYILKYLQDEFSMVQFREN